MLVLTAVLAVAAVAIAACAVTFSVRWAQTRRDIARLATRLERADGEALASLGVDSFGAVDILASRFYRARSDLARQLAAAEFQNTLLLQIMNGMGEGVLAIDRQRRVVLANRGFTEMFDLQPGFVGEPLAAVLRNDAVLAGFDRALGRDAAASRFAIRAGGDERRIEMRAFPLPSHDLAAVALFIDVTRVERLEELRREFIADFSHEVRTPLAALRSAVETFDVAGDALGDDDARQLRRIMTRQLGRLERLAQDLSELSSIESGDLRLERTTIDLRRLLEDLAEDFRDAAAHKQLRFVINGQASAEGDAVRLQQAFANLFDNAVKYGGELADRDRSRRHVDRLGRPHHRSRRRHRRRRARSDLSPLLPRRQKPFTGDRRHGPRPGDHQAPHPPARRHDRGGERAWKRSYLHRHVAAMTAVVYNPPRPEF
jgi:two-component system phosphate regulon sensor histidine kinase PhoR